MTIDATLENGSIRFGDSGDATAAQALVQTVCTELRGQIGRVFVGQSEVVDFVIYTLLAGGHVLIEGVPGLGKTLLVRTLADALHLPMSRVQFTPDLMPADITGTTVLTKSASGGHEPKFQPGPLTSAAILPKDTLPQLDRLFPNGVLSV